MPTVEIAPSPRETKKWVAVVDGIPVHFGAEGFQDFTMHRDERRKENYLRRHAAREDWSPTGLLTAGFWSRWLLWNKPTLRESATDVVHRFPGIAITINKR